MTASTSWKMAFACPSVMHKSLPSVAAVSDASSVTPTVDPSYFQGLQGQSDEVPLPCSFGLDDESATSDSAFPVTTTYQLSDWESLNPELAPIGMDQAVAHGTSAAPGWHPNMTLRAATPISSIDFQLRSPCATDAESGTSTPNSSTEDARSDSSSGVATTRAQAIEPFKEIIRDLYITQNLALLDVKRILEADYGFRETDKVFKNAFSRWSFNKYRSSRQRRNPMASGRPLSGKGRRVSPAKTPPRVPDITRQLLHANPNAMYIETISRATTDFLGTLCVDDGRVSSLRTRLGDISTDIGSLGFLIIDAKRAFRDGNEVQAWIQVRKAFVSIEESIRRLDCRSFMELCFCVPNTLLESKLYDLAARFISHARNLALTRKLGSHHPVTVIMTAACRLLGDPYVSGEILLAAMAQCSADAARLISALHGGVSVNDLPTWCRFNVTPTQAEVQAIANQLGASGGHASSWIPLEEWDGFLFLQEQSRVYIKQYPELAMRDMITLLGVIRGAGCDCWDISRFISRCAGLVVFCQVRRLPRPDFDAMLAEVIARLWDMRPTAVWDFAEMVGYLEVIGRRDVAVRFCRRRRAFLKAQERDAHPEQGAGHNVAGGISGSPGRVMLGRYSGP